MKKNFFFSYCFLLYINFEINAQISFCGDKADDGYVITKIDGWCSGADGLRHRLLTTKLLNNDVNPGTEMVIFDELTPDGWVTINISPYFVDLGLRKTIKKLNDQASPGSFMEILDEKPPVGWVFTSISILNGAITSVLKTITRIDDDAFAGDTMQIYGLNTPPGWVITSIEGIVVGFVKCTITKVDPDASPGTEMTLCGNETVPDGWAIIRDNGICFSGGYKSKTIRKLDTDSPPIPPQPTDNNSYCGDPPSGWVTTSINGTCGPYNSLISRTIQKLDDNASPGDEMIICGDNAPKGWVITYIEPEYYCANVLNLGFTKEIITKLDDKASPGDEMIIYGDTPSGWICTDTYEGATFGKNNNRTSYITILKKKIQKLDDKAAGFETIQACSAGPPPEGWVITSFDGICKDFSHRYPDVGLMGYPVFLSTTVTKVPETIGDEIVFYADKLPPLPGRWEILSKVSYYTPEFIKADKYYSNLFKMRIKRIANGCDSKDGDYTTPELENSAGTDLYQGKISCSLFVTQNSKIHSSIAREVEFSPGFETIISDEGAYIAIAFNTDCKTAIPKKMKSKKSIIDNSIVSNFKITKKTISKTSIEAPKIKMDLYPNPTTGIINFHFDKTDTVIKVFQITDTSGRVVFTHNRNTTRIDISHLANGLYLYFVETDEGSYNGKLIKE